MNQQRIRLINNNPNGNGPVIYWMSRDQRIHHNWAFERTRELAHQNNQPFAIVFNLLPHYLHASKRQYAFMLKGLKLLHQQLDKLHIPFYLVSGNPAVSIPRFVDHIKAGELVADFSPLRTGRMSRESVAKNIAIRMEEVDAHNIVPVWTASQKQEFGAYTLRPKLQKLLPEFLDEFPIVAKQSAPWKLPVPAIDWQSIIPKEQDYDWITSGEQFASDSFNSFITSTLPLYEYRNDPTKNAQSNLSPYLHFGQISAQQIALDVQKIPQTENTKSFLEELIVRKELSDNFCYYNQKYDSVEGFPTWAKASLAIHRNDQREFTYSYEEFEQAKTHDKLWNAAQIQMTTTGKMHGYMRMYWAKKILEWTTTPENAMEVAIKLNDSYELDGRDPNGYTGIAWSIGGIHDRAWFDRPIFGKIRYMNYNGCKSKFNVETYINTWIKQ